MIVLPKTLGAWGSPRFEETFKLEAGSIEANQLPLQQGLSLSSYVADSGFELVVLKTSESLDTISVKVSVFYAGLNVGSCCADDPTPPCEQAEHCEMLFNINKSGAETVVNILDT